MLLFAGYAVKADTPCHVAITSYERQIDSLETRLATAQSLPYNQGYQEGYKVAKMEAKPIYKLVLQGLGIIFIGLVLAVGIIYHKLNQIK
jgi:hypothetical protein